MKNPLSILFEKKSILIILIIIFGLFIVSYILKNFGLYEGMANNSGVSGQTMNIATTYPF